MPQCHFGTEDAIMLFLFFFFFFFLFFLIAIEFVQVGTQETTCS